MDKKTFTIGVLSIIMAVLFIGTLLPTQPAQATTVIKDRDYTLATTRSQRGGEVLYIVDNRTGQIAAVTLDNRQMAPVAIDSLTTLSTAK